MSYSKEEVEAMLQIAIRQGAGVATNMTTRVHRTAYPAISPHRPELSQVGKTILITGGGSNIGLAITKAFVQAKAAKVVIVGRRIEVLEKAKEEILKEVKAGTNTVTVIAKSVDITDQAAVRGLWEELKQGGIGVDVLVQNAAQFGGFQPLLSMGTEEVWSRMEANVYGPLLMAELFSKQGGEGRKCLINVSTAAAHTYDKREMVLASVDPAYNLSKASGTLAMQLVAGDSDPDKLTVVSFHPGQLHTEHWEGAGVSKSMLPFDDVSLPAGAAVWLASPEAMFLHGRLIWASWDVDELKDGELRKRIDDDVIFLKNGLNGYRNGFRTW